MFYFRRRIISKKRIEERQDVKTPIPFTIRRTQEEYKHLTHTKGHSERLMKYIRAKCPSTSIIFNSEISSLSFEGSSSSRRETMLFMYEELRRNYIRFPELRRSADDLRSITRRGKAEHSQGDLLDRYRKLKEDSERKDEEYKKKEEAFLKEMQGLQEKIDLLETKPVIKRESCNCGDTDQLREKLREIQQKYAKIEQILKLREQELEILKDKQDVIKIE